MFELFDVCRDREGRIVGLDVNLGPIVFLIVFVASVVKWSVC